MGIVGAYMVPHPKELIPDIGRGKEWKYPRTIEAYRRIAQEIREIEPETILVISPHAALFQDYFHIFRNRVSMEIFREREPDRFGLTCQMIQNW